MKETLRKLRQEKNYSQSEVAEGIGISRQSYMKYERGEIDPPVKTILDLAKLYEVPYKIIIENRLKDGQVEYDMAEVAPVILSDSGAFSTIPRLNLVLELLSSFEIDELLSLASSAIRLVEKKRKESEPHLQQEEKLALFHRLSGSITERTIQNAREEYLDYLDERYN